jgi:hypothetical protein
MYVVSIYWDPYYNDFTDIDGNLFADIFRIISPSRLLLMKLKRGIWYEKTATDVVYELVFPLEEEDLE